VVAVSPDGQSVYVANSRSDDVSQYDVGAGGALAAKATPTVPTAGGPFGIAVSPDGESVYVANVLGGVSQYDVGAGGALTAKSPPTVPAGTSPIAVAVRPTPSPPAAIADLIDSVEELDLPSGPENSLLKKLTGAQRNLDAGDTDGACGKLASFINQVSAQAGKRIDAPDADELVAEAQAVRESLSCGGG
jgi:YVTN family beta-propeller protein